MRIGGIIIWKNILAGERIDINQRIWKETEIKVKLFKFSHSINANPEKRKSALVCVDK